MTEKSYSPDYHKAGAEQMRRDRERATELATLIETGMQRWEELEALASSIAAARS